MSLFPLIRAQTKLIEHEADYIFRILGGGERGLQSDILAELFHQFYLYVLSRNLSPYAVNRTTPSKLRRLVEVGRFTISGGEPSNKVP